MQTEPSTPQHHKTVHDHLKYRFLKVLMYKGFKLIVIQFYTNRCRTRTTRKYYFANYLTKASLSRMLGDWHVLAALSASIVDRSALLTYSSA
jgi:hypothetical protein